MNLDFDDMSSRETYGVTMRFVPKYEGDVIMGVFSSRPETATGLHLQPLVDIAEYAALAKHGEIKALFTAVYRELLVPHPNEYGFVARETCRVMLERAPYERPLIDPDYFYVAGPREHELAVQMLARPLGAVAGSRLFSWGPGR